MQHCSTLYLAMEKIASSHLKSSKRPIMIMFNRVENLLTKQLVQLKEKESKERKMLLVHKPTSQLTNKIATVTSIRK